MIHYQFFILFYVQFSEQLNQRVLNEGGVVDYQQGRCSRANLNKFLKIKICNARKSAGYKMFVKQMKKQNLKR